jgi:hypothetical protein
MRAARSKALAPNWPTFAPPQWPNFTPPLTEEAELQPVTLPHVSRRSSPGALTVMNRVEQSCARQASRCPIRGIAVGFEAVI